MSSVRLTEAIMISLIWIMTLPQVSATPVDPRIEDLIAKQSQLKQISAHKKVERVNGEKTDVQEGRFLGLKEDGKWLTRWDSEGSTVFKSKPLRSDRMVSVINMTGVFFHIAGTEKAYQSERPNSVAPFTLVQDIIDTHDLEVRDLTEKGDPVLQITATPKPPPVLASGSAKLELTYERSSGLLIRQVDIDADGKEVRVVELTQADLTSALEPSLFEFRPPAGVSVDVRKAGEGPEAIKLPRKKGPNG